MTPPRRLSDREEYESGPPEDEHERLQGVRAVEPRRLSERMRDAVDFGPVKYGHAAYVEKLMALVAEVVLLEARAVAAEVQVKHLINERNQARRERDNALGCVVAAEVPGREL